LFALLALSDGSITDIRQSITQPSFDFAVYPNNEVCPFFDLYISEQPIANVYCQALGADAAGNWKSLSEGYTQLVLYYNPEGTVYR
jgi:hypothetical protein